MYFRKNTTNLYMKIIISISIIAFLMSLIVIVQFNSSYAIDSNENGFIEPAVLKVTVNSKEELQQLVVASAKSYYHNQNYSDYDMYAMDIKSSIYKPGTTDSSKLSADTFMWRDLSITPEKVSRNNNYHIDCSSFVTSVYYNSLHYDFSEYASSAGSTSTLFRNFKYDNINNKENYKNAFQLVSKGPSTSMFQIAGNARVRNIFGIDNAVAGVSYYTDGTTCNDNQGILYKNSSGESKCYPSTRSGSSAYNPILVYYYTPDNTTSKCPSKAKVTEMYNKLEVGDMIVYRHANATGGHTMIYVGDYKDNNGNTIKKGFIHASGVSYDFEKLDFKEDDYSVRVGTKCDYYERLQRSCSDAGVIDNTKRSCTESNKSGGSSDPAVISPYASIDDNVTSMMVFRPINAVCQSYPCTVNIDKNAIARADLAEMKIEQYAKDQNDNNLAKYQSVNIGDTIKYTLLLGNNKIKEYNGLTVTAKVPNNTKYVNCTDSCTYNSTTKTITWTNAGNKLSSSTNSYRTYSYTVKVGASDKIVNEGMTIKTPQGNSLNLSEITTNVNYTLNTSDKRKKIRDTITMAINKKNYITFDGSSSVDNRKFSDLGAELSPQSFVRMIYYNAFFKSDGERFKLSILNKSNVKKSLFYTTDNVNYYRTTSNINNVSTTTYNNMNNMVVSNNGYEYFGGSAIEPNSGLNGKQLSLSDIKLKPGDIIYPFISDNGVIADKSGAYIYDDDSSGNPVFVKLDDVNGIEVYRSEIAEGDYPTAPDNNNYSVSSTSAENLFKYLSSRDIYVILRPRQAYNDLSLIDENTFNDKLTRTIKEAIDAKNYISFKSDSSLYEKLFSELSVELSPQSFVRMIYYDAYNVDLSSLTKNKIKNSLFTSSSDFQYFQKNTYSSQISYLDNLTYYSRLTGKSDINNKLLIPGLYGGRYLLGNDGLDRTKYMTINDLEVGDIVFSFYHTATSSDIANISAAYIYDEDTNANPVFIKLSSSKTASCDIDIYRSINAGGTYVPINGKIEGFDYTLQNKTSEQLFGELYAQDLFAIFRPSQNDASIKYEYNGGNGSILGDSNFKGQNISLPTATRNNITITYNYNGKNSTNLETTQISTSTFEGWYNDENLSDKVGNSGDSYTLNEDTTLYAKWTTTAQTLPTPSYSGYTFGGWYSDSALTKKIGNGGSKYQSEENITLYARWTQDSVKITPEISMSIDSPVNCYFSGDKVNFKITVKNGHDFAIKNIILKEDDSGSKFISGTGYTLVNDKEINISEIPANSSAVVNASYQVGNEFIKNVTNAVTIMDANSDNNGILDASKSYTSSVTFKVANITLNVNSIDIDDNNLSGTEFSLYSDSSLASLVSKGISFSRLVPNTTYYLKQTKASSGYSILNDILTVTVDSSGTISIAGYTVTNNNGLSSVNIVSYKNNELPITGEVGNLPYILGGLIIVIGSLVGYVYYLSRKGRVSINVNKAKK